MIDFWKSKTVWTIVGLFVFNGLQAIAPQVSGQVSVVVNVLVSLLAVYFRAFPNPAL